MRVLVVDDFPGAAEASAVVLKLLGHETEMAFTGRDALAKARTFDPDLIILDIGLPDIDGFQVARSIRELPQGQRVHIAALTGWDQPTDRKRGALVGIDSYASKPADATTLRNIVANAANRTRAA